MNFHKYGFLYPCNTNGTFKNVPEQEYMFEKRAADLLGVPWTLFDYDMFTKNGKLIITEESQLGFNVDIIVYRGWMLKPHRFDDLLYDISQKYPNSKLINNVDEYSFMHYLINSYDNLKGYMPSIVYQPVFPNPETNQRYIMILYDKANVLKSCTGINKFVLKDFVKSEKGNDDLLFIHPHEFDDYTLFHNKIQKFIKERGSLYNEGICLRQYVELKEYTKQLPPSTELSYLCITPQYNEWRSFVLNDKIITTTLNSNLDGWIAKPPTTYLNNIVKSANKMSNFWTFDVAELSNGEWILLETGDGQVSGLTPQQNVLEFVTNFK